MFKAKNKITSVIVSFCMLVLTAVLAISAWTMPMNASVTATAADTKYVETSFGAGKFLITTTYNGATYYLPATTTTSKAPVATKFTDVNTISEEHLWTVTATGSNYYIQNADGKYLYTTSTNNGVRVSSTNNAWLYNSSENSLKDTKTNRYLGIYNAQDWRCYTTVTQSNYKESSKSFKFYKVDDSIDCVECDYNNVYTYTDNGNGTHSKAGTCTVCKKDAIIDEKENCKVTEWSAYTPNEGTHSRTGECTLCGATVTETENCQVGGAYTRNGNEHTKDGTCSVCGDGTSVTEDCTLTTNGYAALETDDKEVQQHAITTTCSVCELTATNNEACSFDEGVLNGTTLTYTCQHCAYSYAEEVTAYTVNYVVPNGVIGGDSENIPENFTVTLPTPGVKNGYAFIGWTTKEYKANSVMPNDIHKAGEVYTVTEDVTFYALYSYLIGSGKWEKVTNADDLKIGNEIIIASSDAKTAIGKTQNSNNRKSESFNASNIGDAVQKITLEAGAADGTYAFHVKGGTGTNAADGYLYATGTGNHLRTQKSIDNNASWNISITSAGVATIKANISGQNWLRKNSNSDLFSCYTSGQNDVSIYQYNSVTYYTTDWLANIESASITIGEDITLNYYVSMADNMFANAIMKFSYESKTYDVEGKKVENRYVYSLELAPQYMASNVKAELVFDYNGKEVTLDVMENYSIKAYAQNKLNAAESSDELKQLLTDLLHYGNAAYNYKNETTGTIVTDDVENLGTASTATPTTTDFTLEKNEEISSYPAWFKGAGVWFDNVNKLYVKLSTTENVTLKINGEEVAVTGTTVYTDGIKATGFAETYTFELYHDGVLMQTLTYSINAYAYQMQNDAAMKDLALALYRYGVSAAAYKTPVNA